MSVSFRVASYDRAKPLIIDPALVYSTYLGGSSGPDSGTAIVVDSSGHAYVTGAASSIDFPTTAGAFQKTNKAAADQNSNAFVTKLGPAGAALVYSTYLGGSGGDGGDGDYGNGIAVDSSGDAYVTGYTYSSDFPTTAGAFQKTNNALGNFAPNAFVSKLGPAGAALVYSTYLGGSGATFVGASDGTNGDVGAGLAVDGSGNAYVTGYTNSSDFPTTAGAFQKTNKETYTAFVTKLGPAGAALVYSTYLGGSGGDGFGDVGTGLAVDSSGHAYVTGYTSSTDFPTTAGAFQTGKNHLAVSYDPTAFVTKLGPAGAALDYSTYLGGSEEDLAYGIAVDSSGHAYVTGYTFSSDFPTTAGAFQTTNKAFGNGSTNVFVTKLGPAGAALVYSTYLGGAGLPAVNGGGYIGDDGNGIAVDSSGHAYVTGYTFSSDFPTTAGAFQTTNKGDTNAFVTKLGPAGAALDYSSYLGGSGAPYDGFSDKGAGIAVDGGGDAYVTGSTTSNDFPTTAGAFQTTRPTNTAAGNDAPSAFVTKIKTE